MFEKHWWSGAISSYEGFTVTFVARHTLMYEEGGKSVTFRTEGDNKSIDIFKHSIVVPRSTLLRTSVLPTTLLVL